MKGFRAERRGDRLYLPGLTDPWNDIIEHLLHKGGVLVITKTPGKSGWKALGVQGYYPTAYELSFMLPTGKQKDFSGEFRVEDVLVSVHPGKKYAAATRELHEAMYAHAAGKPVDFAALRDRYPYR